MNGATVSGSSGAVAPYTPQFSVRPSLTAATCSAVSVTLNSTASAFASCGVSLDVRLSRYIPASASQNASLNARFRAEAFAAYALASAVSFTQVARSTLFVRT